MFFSLFLSKCVKNSTERRKKMAKSTKWQQTTLTFNSTSIVCRNKYIFMNNMRRDYRVVCVPYVLLPRTCSHARNNQVIANIFLYVVINAAINQKTEKRSIETLIYKLDEPKRFENWILVGYKCDCDNCALTERINDKLNEYFMRFNVII